MLNQVHQISALTPTDQAKDLKVKVVDNKFGIDPFYIEMASDTINDTEFSFNAPTTLFNTLRLLRGMQLNKAILLEGSPGVGKTSLVMALAKVTGYKLFRVNLSDQTVSSMEFYIGCIKIKVKTYFCFCLVLANVVDLILFFINTRF